MSDIKLCYSFSARVDKLGFIDLLHSLHTVKQYFSKEDIIVFFTPPFNDDYEQQIARYATVIKKDHYPIPHPTYDPNDPTPPYYWDKFYFTEVDCDNLIFMDNDTELQRDIRTYFDPQDFTKRKEEIAKHAITEQVGKTAQMVDPNFDILVFGNDYRSGATFEENWAATWNYLQTAQKVLVMTTAILFRNKTHTKLKEETSRMAKAYMIDKAIRMPAEDRLFDEYVFSLATRDYNVQIMPKNIDMVWTSVDSTRDRRDHAAILHGGGRRVLRVGNISTAYKSFDNELLQLIEDRGEGTRNVPLRHWIERVGATFLTMLEDKYPKFNVYFRLEGNTIVMHTTIELPQESVDYIYSYVWADKPAEFGFTTRGDLK